MSSAPPGNLVIRASAGSGKTFRLTGQYLALLASGVPPSQIWAATFTRKAAGEILDRVLERLIAAAGSDAEANELAEQIGCPDLSQSNCTCLLRELLGSLHRLRIGTLDSLFLKLGGAFGLECGLPPGWSICDEVEDQAANEMALDAILAGDRDRQTWLAERYERLTHGEARRGVRSDLLGRIANWYAAYRTVPKEDWQMQSPPRPLESLDDLLEALEAAGSGCDKRMKTACEKDCILAREPRWDEFFTKGLGPKIYSAEDPEYNRKPIPQVLIDLYRRILPIARFNVLGELAAETAALWEFLDEFHRHREEVRTSSGALRFDDVTLALAEHLAPESAGFQFRLDGGIGHLLIDEFQDTSTAQWRVLRKLAEERLRSGWTFFAVGDVKQAIYGWRGGRVELLQRLHEDLGGLPTDQMDESRRSAPEIVDVVNRVFENVIAAVDGEWWEDGDLPWNKDFRHHTTFEKARKGYVHIETGPAQAEGEGIAAVRTRHYAWVAGRIKKLVEVKPTATIGVLCRTNSAVGHLLFDLRQLGVEASEEGENPITDSPAVELILSLLTLADHPGDRIAAFHLAHSPLAERLVESGFQENETAEFASRLRRSLVEDGYAAVVARWADELAGCCPAADRLRLRQLVELADAHQARATLRPAEFVAWVRKERISAPSASRLRVLTLHKGKGLEFDAVVLPQLDVPLKGRPADFVVADPGPTSNDHGFVARRPSSGLQLLLDDSARKHIADAERRGAEEMLSALYVALTRPKYALYAFPPGPQLKNRTDHWDTLLLKALGLHEAADVKKRPLETTVYRQGDEDWHPKPSPDKKSASTTVKKIRFRESPSTGRRVEWVAPSRLESGRVIDAARLFSDGDSRGREIGVLHHAWFEEVEWLDDGEPTDEALWAVAARLPYPERDLDVQLAGFRKATKAPAIRERLSRAYYHKPQQVERERPFAIRVGRQIVNGRIDRLVYYQASDGSPAIEVIDFKTDAISLEGMPARVAEYRPQIESYIRAVAAFVGLPVTRVNAALLFTALGCIEPIRCSET